MKRYRNNDIGFICQLFKYRGEHYSYHRGDIHSVSVFKGQNKLARGRIITKAGLNAVKGKRLYQQGAHKLSGMA